MKFTKEQLKDIEDSRARLQAFQIKCGQTFPPLPIGVEVALNSESKVQILDGQPEWSNRQWDTVQQLQAEVRGWRTKNFTTLKEIDKLRALVSKKDDGVLYV